MHSFSASKTFVAMLSHYRHCFSELSPLYNCIVLFFQFQKKWIKNPNTQPVQNWASIAYTAFSIAYLFEVFHFKPNTVNLLRWLTESHKYHYSETKLQSDCKLINCPHQLRFNYKKRSLLLLRRRQYFTIRRSSAVHCIGL